MPACLDPSVGWRRACSRVAALGLGLLLGAAACAPQPFQRAAHPSVEDEDDRDGRAFGGRGGHQGGNAGRGGSGGAGGGPTSLDAAPDLGPVVDSGPMGAGDTSEPSRDLAAPDQRAGGPDLPPGVNLSTGLVHHWKFDEGTGLLAADSVSGGNNGTLSGKAPPMWVAGPPKILGNSSALSFDGIDQFVALKDSLAPVLGGTATLSCWFKTNQTGTGNPYDAPGITGADDSGGSNDIFWGFLDGGGALNFRAGNGSTVKTSAPINDGAWHHVVLTRDKMTGLLQLYLDGKPPRSATSSTGDKTTPFSALGRITGSSKPYFRGQLDDVRIWDRVVTADEAAALFAGY